MSSRIFYNHVCGCYKKLPLRSNDEFSPVQPVFVTVVREMTMQCKLGIVWQETVALNRQTLQVMTCIVQNLSQCGRS